MKQAFKSKTLWFSGALVVLGFAEQHMQTIQAFVPQEYTGVLVSGIGFAVAVLRFLTTAPVSEK